MSKPFTYGGRLSRPLHGGAPAVRDEVRRILAEEITWFNGAIATDGRCAQARALGMAEAVRYFAPAAGQRLVEEVMQVLRGERDPKTWRRRRDAKAGTEGR